MNTPLIVIVDDDADLRATLRVTLEDEGYEVAEATDGPSLLEVLRARRPALILLDVMLSWIDGFGLCEALKRNWEYAGVPICFLSGRTSPEDVRHGMLAGAAHYFCKPLHLDDLLDRIAALIEESAGHPERPGPAAH